MDYDWSGVKTRRITLFKRTSLMLLGAGFPLTVLAWLQLVH